MSHAHPHAMVTRQIVTALLRLPHADQRQFMRAAVEFLRRESFTDVASIHDFITAPETAILPALRREELLGVVLRAARDGDVNALATATPQHS